jgi:hypothetical protein
MTAVPPVTTPLANNRDVVLSTAAQWLTVPLLVTLPSVTATETEDRPSGEPAPGEPNTVPRV